MSLDEGARRKGQRRQAIGRGLRIAGVLIAVFCGLCTATCAGPAAVSTIRGTDEGYGPIFLSIAAVIGVLPFVIGLVLALVGHRMARTPKADDRDA